MTAEVIEIGRKRTVGDECPRDLPGKAGHDHHVGSRDRLYAMIQSDAAGQLAIRRTAPPSSSSTGGAREVS